MKRRPLPVRALAAATLWAAVVCLWVANPAGAVELAPGDIVVADVDSFGGTAGVFRVDPATGAQTEIVGGAPFDHPSGIAIDEDGQVLLIDQNFGGPLNAALVRIDPATGGHEVVATADHFDDPFGIAVEASGKILVADRAFGGIIRVDPTSGSQSVVSQGGELVDPTGLAVEPDGDILVADMEAFGGSGGVLRINPSTGAQAIVSQGGAFTDPFAVARELDGDLLVDDADRVIRIDAVTGEQTTLSAGGAVTGAFGVAVEADGDILTAGTDGFGDGNVARIHPRTGFAARLSSGGSLVNPRAVTVVPAPPSPPAPPAPGDIFLADGAAFDRGGDVINVDPATGAQEWVSPGLFADDRGHWPGVVVSEDGDLFVTKVLAAGFLPEGHVLRVDPVTGERQLVSRGGSLSALRGVALERDGDIVVVGSAYTDQLTPEGVVVRVDPATGAQTVISEGGSLIVPTGVAIEPDGDVLIADLGLPSEVPGGLIRVDPETGVQTVISEGGMLAHPTGVAIEASGDILATSVNVQGFEVVGAIVRVDPVSGAQSVVSQAHGHSLLGLALEDDGDIVAILEHDVVIRVDPITGAQTTLSQGGSLRSPRGIAVMPHPNRDPAAAGDVYATAEDSPLDVTAPGVLGNDTDADGDVLNAGVVTNPDHGTLALAADGSFTYTPDPDFAGTDSFQYAAADGRGGTDTGTVTVGVRPVNDAPVARGDTYAVAEDTPLEVSAPGVLSNDADVDGDALTAQLASGPSHGTLSLAPGGSFTYAPDPDFAGTDSFTYHAGDGQSTSVPASVAIEVRPVNDPPRITRVDGPADPLALGSAATITAGFADPDTGDEHICTFIWGDGIANATAASEGACEASHTYAAAGVHTVAVHVVDSANARDSRPFEFVVVYDRNAGFVTGAGSIDSPPGAYSLDPEAEGRARFGFVSRYQQGSTRPSGNTSFRFDSSAFTFESTDYQWLVVSGARAQYKGTGRANGVPGFGFMLTAVDGARPGGGGTDRFRIKVWDLVGGVIYDNARGTPDQSAMTDLQEITSGQIVIHEQGN